jgi:Dyp-type peroxidase family
MAKLELDDIQGILARGYGRLRAARFITFGIDDPSRARRWLAGLADDVTPASADPRDKAVHVAFTAAGMSGLGLGETTTAGFPHELREGMATTHRQRMLGDVDANAPGGWRWGGPSTRAVDGVLLLYAVDEPSMESLAAGHLTRMATGGVSPIATLNTDDIGDSEPFGFRDGISQPIVTEFGKEGSKPHTVAAGEFVLGYPNEYGLLTDRPLVPAEADRSNLLPRDSAGSEAHDFGRNGSYVVLRQLEQDVAGFWQFLDGATKNSEGGSQPDERVRLGARMVGRWPGGAPLAMSPDTDREDLSKENEFGYHKQDAEGLGCPIGAHVRRANPRDSLDPNPGSDSSIALNRRHRILRRGRAYGPRLTVDDALVAGAGDGVERGLHFMCLVGNIARQFEFIQHTWSNNPKFDGLYEEVDPMIGARGPNGGTFTIPDRPVRQRITGIPSFVTVRGGAYFFLPGIRALRYLASLS